MEVKLTRVGGSLKVDIDGNIYEPLSFKSFRPSARNISDFHKAGVRLFSILSSGMISMLGVPYSLYGESWVGDGQYDFEPVDKQIKLFLDNAPEGYFALMFQLDTRPWYAQKHGVPYSFTHLSQVCTDDTWRKDASAYMKALIEHVESHYGERFYGYFLLCGMTTEWFSAKDFLEGHPIKEKAYQTWKHDENATIPPLSAVSRENTTVFYDDKAVTDYVRFHNECIADTILYFAAEAQKIIRHKKLLGLYYGYLFELSGARLWNDGSLGFRKVFDSPDIDMISSPSSYAFRKHVDPSAFMVTYDSLDRRNKLYYLEFDHITHLAPKVVDGSTVPIPGAGSKLKDEQETIDIMRRDFVLTLTKGAALWWFDMFEGWFYSDGMMNEVARMIAIEKEAEKIRMESIAEIAVFASGEALYGVNKESAINVRLLDRQRGGLASLGAPYDVFETEDVASVDLSRYKLIIFEDALSLSPKVRDFVQNTLKKSGKTILWCYAPGYIDGGLSEIETLTGIKTDLYTGEAFTAEAYGVSYGFARRYDPLFVPTEGEILGRYEDGAPALVRKRLPGCISVYSALGDLPGKVLRALAADAGVTVYGGNDEYVYVNSALIGLCAKNDGTHTLRLPRDGKVTELFSGETVNVKDGVLETGNMHTGEVRLYRYQERKA